MSEAMTETTICVKCKHHYTSTIAHLCDLLDTSMVGWIDPVTGEEGKPIEVQCAHRNFGACPLWEPAE